MINVFKKMSEETRLKIRKYLFLAESIVCTFLIFLLLFVPYCLYQVDKVSSNFYDTLLPIHVFSLFKSEEYVIDGIAYIALGLFIAVFLFIGLGALFMVKSTLGFFNDEEKLAKNTKALLILASVVTGLYFLSSIIVCAIVRANGGRMRVAGNFYPFIIVLLVDILYAVAAGLFRHYNSEKSIEESKEEERKQKLRNERLEIYKARAELFIFTIIIVVLALVATLSNIVTITYKNVGDALDPIKLSGAELLRESLDLDEGGQLVAYIIMFMLVLIGTAFFLSLVSFVSRSDTFYKITLTTLAVSVVATFLVGMFGKYYQVVQKLNEGMLKEYIETLLSMTGLGKVDYEIKSASLYYFFASVILIGVLLVRNPYTRGITAERELALRRANENPHTIKGEVSLTDVPDNLTKLNNGTIVSTDQATGQQTVFFADPCPVFTELDEKIPEFTAELNEKRKALFEEPTLPKLVQFIVQYARDSRLHLSYTEEDIAAFVAGLGTTKLSILQGMSGTGKTSLPKIFSEALYSRCEIVEVESSWRDKNELLGYYNEFSKSYTPKKFTQALYRAKLNPETLTFIVLDEMNLSRIEYYFSDFLSLMENEPDKRELRLLNVGLYRIENGEKVPYRGITDGHTLKVPSNVWFIGTANRDESTFEISDKVYDRAHTMNFNKRASKVLYYNEPIPQRFLPVDMLETLFDEAKKSVKFNLDAYPVVGEVEKLLAPYNISFGNRIAMQIESFVNVYCSCFAISESVIHSALEKILLSKVVSKLELKSVDNKEQLAAEFERLNLRECSKFILKLNED